MSYKLVFFGSNQYSVTVLKALLADSNFTVSTVVTKPDAPANRGQILTSNPVAIYCKENHVPLLQPIDFTQEFVQQFKSLEPDIAVVVAYGPPFFTQEMIDLPTYKVVNLHPSPLPKYRGAAPAPWQIINGESTSALSIFQIDALPDHGPIIAMLPFPISPTETSNTFYEKAFNIGAQSLGKILLDYIQTYPAMLKPQNHTEKTYYPRMDKSVAKINWNQSAEYNQRFIRAMQPWPIAWTEIIGKDREKRTMKVFSSSIKNNQLELENVQIEGKKLANWSQLKEHYAIFHE